MGHDRPAGQDPRQSWRTTAISLSSKPERFQTACKKCTCSGSGERREVETTWFHNGTLIFKFRGIDTISDAEPADRLEVRVPLAERAPLEAGEFFQSDLIGCEVFEHRSGQRIGRVTDWQDGGGAGLLVVDGHLLIPFARAICVEIDPAAKRIAVELPPGLQGTQPTRDLPCADDFPRILRGAVRARSGEAGAKTPGFSISASTICAIGRFDRHKTVDDRPFGGGEGMVMKPEPLFQAVESIWPERGRRGRKPFCFPRKAAVRPGDGQPPARGRAELLLICGRYEGVDERVAEHLADDEISIGNYVLSGGELAAAVVIDTVARLLPGVLGNETSAAFDSFQESGHGEGLLDCPHWTRPADFRGWKAPEVLLNGNHEEIRKFRKNAALEKTARLRPDLRQ